MKKLLVYLPILFVLVGCSRTIPVNYVPSPSIRGSGDIEVGKFVYTPYIKKEVKANQFQSAPGAIGAMYLSENVSALLEQSLTKELIASGFSTGNTANLKISGEVKKFLYDWTNLIEMDIYLDIKYAISRSGNLIITKNISSHKVLPKLPVYDSEVIRATISDNISKLFIELRRDKIL